MGAFDDLIPQSAGGAFDDLVPAKKQRGDLSARELLVSVLGNLNSGGRSLARMVTDAAQAPLDTINETIAAVPAATDRLVTKGLNEFLPLPSGAKWQENQDLQDVARTLSAIAQDTRAANLNADDQSVAAWLNPRTAAARIGKGLEERMRADAATEQQALAEATPNITEQAKAISDATGFVGTAKAIAQNPAGMVPSLAESVPAMAVGLGAARKVAGATLRTGAAEAESAAARVAAAGGDAAEQAAARQAVLDGAEQLATRRASAAGAGSEAITSASQSGDKAYDEVMATPVETLAARSERFQQLVSELGSPDAARERLANEVRGMSKGLVGLATLAGTRVVNRAFGEDTTARLAAGVGKSSWKDVPKNMLHEGLEEVAQGVGQDLAEYGAGTIADPSRKLDLGGSAAQNFAAGAAMGGPTTAGKVAWDRATAPRAAVPENGAVVPETGDVVAPNAASVAPAAAAVAVSGPTEAERALFQPRQLTALDRVEEINTEAERAQQRLAELNRPGADYGPMFDGERADLQQQIAALGAERDGLTRDWPQAAPGAETSFTTESGARIDARYALVSADDLVTSHDSGLRPNPAYPQELQPRERERAASEMQIAGIAQRLDPARLGASADAANGAPIIGADGLVESGNSRSIALKRVYRVPGEKAEAYREFLRQNAAQFGIDPAQVDAISKPVLVRVRRTPVDRAEFARQANAPTIAQMSPSEQARADAKRIDAMEDLQPDENGDFTGAASRPFIQRFLARLPATEQAAMIDSSGQLSTAGYQRVRNAVLAKAYGDSPVLARMTESLDDNLRNISKALIVAAPRVAAMREAVGQGVRHSADFTPDLMTAVEELSALKERGTSVADALAQGGLMGDEYSPETRAILEFLADNIRRPRRMADFVVAYTEALDAAGNPQQASLIDDAAPPTKFDLMGQAQRSIDGTPRDPAAAAGAEDAQRGITGQDAQAGEAAGERQAVAPSGGRRDQGAGPAAAGDQQQVAAWIGFPPESGTLGVPRAEMPQILMEHRGALTNFLNARGVEHERLDVPAADLKPTQAEFSPAKVRKAAELDNPDRAVLVSSDGHVLDGHHQWLAKAVEGDAVPVLRFNAPIRELLQLAREFPSARVSDGAPAGLSEEASAQLESMRQQAEAEKPGFDGQLKGIAESVGGTVQLAAVKRAARAAAKALADYDGDVTKVRDLLRGTIVIDDAARAADVIAQLEKAFDVLPSGRRNNLDPAASTEDGYRDAKLNVRLPSGVIAEVQVSLQPLLDAKKEGHALYEERQALARQHGAEPPAAVQMQIDDLNARMRALYDAAWSVAWTNRASQSAAESGTPSENAVRGVNGRGTSLSNAVASERSSEVRSSPSLTATGMSSTSKNTVPLGNVDAAGTLGRSTAEASSRFMETSAPSVPPRVSEIEAFVQQLAAKWGNAPAVKVLSSMDDPSLPSEVRDVDQQQRSQGATGEPDGFFHRGQVYLVANQLATDADAARVLFHEALGHYGLRGVFGDTLTPILAQLAAARPDLVKPKAQAYGLDLRDAEQRLQAAEEVLAELAQSKPELGFVRRAAAAIRSWLRANVPGMAKLQISNDEIVRSYILPARGWVERGRQSAAADSAPVLSRRTVDTAKPVAERADEIIAAKVRRRAPVDAVFRWAVNDVAHLPQVIEAGIRAAGAGIDRALAMLPQSAQETIAGVAERVRAGVISDYGVPEAVIDQRAMLQGRQRVQLRQAGKLVDQLANLTRAESRVAYEWMNEQGDTERAAELMKQLPPESVKVLESVRDMIDRLSQDAVHLGQLSAEAFERNRFAYLRRSYAKHILEERQEGGKPRRSRTLAVLGEQYKGRGITDGANMKQIQNAAPDWWKRKLATGKADTSLKGQKFLRLEKHAPTGEGTAPLEGMEDRARGRLQDVHYWPADEQLPAKYADWDQAGTFEVRDVKGDQVVMWRDFTKAEREQMGEVDEARFAIAKTLQGMVHDVETGRYLEWLAHKHAVKNEAAVPGTIVDASEAWHRAFKPGEWVLVPESKIPGTSVAKYGKLAGRYLPGPIWNDLRQTVGGQFKPFGETFSRVLSAWKTAKTALSPGVHTNNIMSNMVMADWHDITAAHQAKALRILLGSHDLGGEGALGRAGNAVAGFGGIADREAALAIVNRYKDSGGDIGSWATQEIARDQLEPLLAAIEAEAAVGNPDSPDAKLAAASALHLALSGQLSAAAKAAAVSAGKKVVTEAKTVIDLYQVEDEVFRLAQWLKAKEDGASDLEAGKLARKSFMDYSINAPWVQAMRATAFPFIAYTYRAAPMLLDVARRKPHKLLKLMALAAAANYLGVMIAGGGDDKERKLLPEEKAGGVWGLVPKLIRMPWNDANGSPVYLDIRRFIPVGDVVDLGAGHAALPLPPSLQPGGPLAMLGELAFNTSAFTGKPITLETDTAGEKAAKVLDHVYKFATPNLLGVPNTYATQGVVDAVNGRTDAFGREQSVAQALGSTVGIKLGSYPADVLRANLAAKARAEVAEIDKQIAGLKRQRQTNRISDDELSAKIKVQQAKKEKVYRELAEKTGG